MTILEALDDRQLFGGALRRPETWRAWCAFLAALFGLPLDAEQAALFAQCTARSAPPAAPQREAWLVCGRRAGKSFVLALVAVFLACFREYRAHLGPGERATVMVIATDRKQARVITRYVRGLIFGAPMLARMVERETAESIDLDNAASVEVQTASYRTTRGYTLAAALCDEIAFWPTDDAAEPDYAVLDALRPGMATIPGAVLLCASSPYARRGALWDAFRRWWGKDDAPALVWRAATRTMNPTVPQHVIDDAVERDPASAGAEYLAEFRADIEAFIAREVVDAAVVPGRHELPPVSGQSYLAFVDPSGGSSDSFTLAIAHREGERGVLDAVREYRPPFSPEAVVEEFAGLLAAYGIRKVAGDRYGGEWPRERFRARSVEYEPSAKSKSDIYREMLPILNSGRAELLDHPRLRAQLTGLERRTARGGRDSIDHAPGAHDDVANAVAGALVAAAGKLDALEVWRRLAEMH